MENSATRKVIDEGTIEFLLMTDALLHYKAFVIFLNQGTISSRLEPYMEKGSISVLKVIL